MSSQKVIFLTRTKWSEPPRLRHQVARLMCDRGHKVTFVERPYQVPFGRRSIESGICPSLVQHSELIHHQLKPLALVQRYNAQFVSSALKKLVSCDEYSVVFNFNYDYGFTRKLFPKARFITILNDDFEAQARSWMRKAIRRQLESCCSVSDSVLTVSEPLRQKLAYIDRPVELFLPWPANSYRRPNSIDRNVCLYFGFLNHRIDFGVLEFLLGRGLSIRAVGPIEGKAARKHVARLARYEQFSYLPPAKLDDVPIDDVYCSVIPYDTRVESVRAVSIGNRAFQLLSSGIPIVYPKLPGLLDNAGLAIRTAETNMEYLEAVEYYKKNFEKVQSDIEQFVKPHNPVARYEQLARHFTQIHD